jgi:hypothetical protein
MEWTTQTPPNPFTLLFVLLVILLIMRTAEVGCAISAPPELRTWAVLGGTDGGQ